ncbi:tRNA (adenosine(37)-N6)-dimethylallyltransferase MiaA [Solitalea sp. MAHUQ-68]|uniref:tRNA dimethylallyltransferase n=1 Tax=Solitalea agri TaxID=2953739 RepID=A0A9X2JAF7_9SPHI|nr:tRNA (adenosine(37)-N6)-dimethylallyltransferase MiaA [Solitalea agri]MCO4291367.1 tRNA (adenosine(37)-N6)-dimethylallyltransferase MiaA [Solitalea agri]
MGETDLIVILGPTASGKTRLAVRLAYELNGEIISADSRQVYKDMNIGTGKDLHEFEINGTSIPHHLINIREAGEKYNIFEFQQDFERAYTSIKAKGKVAVLCGGTGLYIESVLKDFQYTSVPIDENLRVELAFKSKEELTTIHQQLTSSYSGLADTSTIKRLIRAIEISTYLNKNAHDFHSLPQVNAFIFGIDISRELRRERISERLLKRISEGMIEEVQQLLAKGVSMETLVYYGLEYKFIAQYLNAELDYETMLERLETAIHQFAKRQMTYFRKMEKDGLTINWINGEEPLDEQLRVLVKTIKQ